MPSVRPSVCPHEKLGYDWPDCQEIWYLRIFQKSVEKTQVTLSLARITGTLHEDLCTCVIIPRWILLRMGNVSNRSCGENQNGHFTFNTVFSRKSCRLWDNLKKIYMAEADRTQVATQYGNEKMRFACRRTKARIQTTTHHIINSSTEYFVAGQQWKGNTLFHIRGNTEHLHSAQLHLHKQQWKGKALLKLTWQRRICKCATM